MIDLLQTYTLLASSLRDDPVLCLAHAAAWLDPLRGDVDDIDTPENEEDSVLVALHILRRAFPDSYFDALQAIRHNASYQQLEGLICAAMQKEGIPLEQIEWLSWGIPLPAYGVTLDDPDFYAVHPDDLFFTVTLAMLLFAHETVPPVVFILPKHSHFIWLNFMGLGQVGSYRNCKICDTLVLICTEEVSDDHYKILRLTEVDLIWFQHCGDCRCAA